MKETSNTHLKKGYKRFNCIFVLTALLGLYLIFAWASYSPLDNSWTISSSVTTGTTLNKTGVIGAWLIDILYAAFGKITFIIPFSLLGVSVYMLILRLATQTTWKYLALRGLSFLLFLIGLSGIASVILSNSSAYLAGGFIGGIFQSYLAETIGQFMALVVAMIFTVVGFYFCSGQMLLPLFSAFYEWIFAKNTTAENTDILQKNQENRPLEMADSMSERPKFLDEMNAVNSADEPPFIEPSQFIEEEQKSETQDMFVDPSVFSRPHIIGLKQTENVAPIIDEQMENDLTDVAMFNVNETIPLPQVHIPSTLQESAPAENHSSMNHDESAYIVSESTTLPKIRLHTADVDPVRELDAPIISLKAEPSVQLKHEVADSIAHESILKEESLNDRFDDSMQNNQFSSQEQADVLADKPQTTQLENEVTYPKGYPDTLIHPLLQRKSNMEKPTTPFPTLDLLAVSKTVVQQATEQEIRETSRHLEQALANYGVKATVEDVVIGPVVTRYEIKPAAGVKAAKITGLANDLARELMFEAIRITEVVPGKPYMGIETPTKQRETVWLRDVLDSDAFRHSKAILPMALGMGISGEPIVVDMAKMPHLLVAGQTGGGKSVGLNAMILSLLYKFTPEQLRFIMIDPKVVELSIYDDIPHLLTPVVVDMKKAANALRWAVEEMERRYQLVSYLNVRNIEGYNAKIDQAAEMNLPIPDPSWRPSSSMDQLPPPLTKLSYIVLIVDEFGDLMVSAGKEVEEHIMRIAQKARAVGIHLILATQRPSTDVITGVIKANIPSRIAFTVATQIDSRTILDKSGAESLLGYGDMLYSGAGSPDIIRVHGAYMNDEDVKRVADDWRARGKPNYLESILESAEGEDTLRNELGGDLDPLFDEVVEFVIESGVTSISGVQRRFSLGFNRAGRIIDQMEAQGIISEAGKGGKREVLAR